MNTAIRSKVEIVKVTVKWLTDEDPDLSFLDQFENSKDKEEKKYYIEDQKRKSDYGNRWYMQGCKAYAEVRYEMENVYPAGNYRLETLSSGGLWGIESDSDSDCLKDTEKEQLKELKNHLEHFGIDTTDFYSRIA